MYKVLFHLNDPMKKDQVLGNIENALKDFKEGELKIKLVVHSQGVLPFTNSGNPDLEKINSILSRNTEIAVCSNTMKAYNLNTEDFPFKISTVSSGMGEIIRSQANNWIYIKP